MKYLLFIGALFLTSISLAQDPAALRKEKMKPAMFIAGKWAGSGWMEINGTKHTFNQTEDVTPQVDGGLLVVLGKGRDTASGELIHDAFGMLTYDVVRKQYRWITSTGKGYTGDMSAEISENKFIWGMESPATGKMRYTITLDKGDWFEIGERSSDGATWTKFFEMRLKKM